VCEGVDLVWCTPDAPCNVEDFGAAAEPIDPVTVQKIRLAAEFAADLNAKLRGHLAMTTP
jgi:hypothetical protein